VDRSFPDAIEKQVTMRYHAILFDLDGTLLDSLEDLADSANAALAAMDLPQHPLEAYKLFVGDGLETLLRRTMGPRASDPAEVARGIELARQEYARRWADKSRPYPGVPEMLDRLTACGIPMAVLSNKPDEFTRLCVTRLLSAWQFAAVQGATPELPKKPDPRGALAIAARLGIAPADFLYLGDTNTDMRTAIAAGMYPVGALWGFRTAEELRDAGAAVLAKDPLDVLAFSA
jgi:phosphoglycolate phosphatase